MKNVEIVKTKYFDYLLFNRLKEYPELIHFYTLRKKDFGLAKVHTDIYSSSLSKICDYLEIDTNSVIHPNQDHTKNIFDLNNQDINSDFFDSIIVNKNNILTITTSADCVPILLYDTKNKVFSNIHAGWRGIVQNIIIRSLNQMINNYNSDPKNIIAFIFPCIHKNNFLVNNDVKEIYENTFPDEISKYDIIKTTNKYNDKGPQYSIDNIELITKLLIKSGLSINNIIDSEICTVDNVDLFYSKRGDNELINTNGLCVMLNNYPPV